MLHSVVKFQHFEWEIVGLNCGQMLLRMICKASDCCFYSDQVTPCLC